MKEGSGVDETVTKKCLQYSLRLLSVSPRTCAGLSKRLQEKGYNKSSIKEVIQYLTEQNLINDTAYAKAYVEEMTTKRPCGRHRLKYELKRKGIPDNVIERTLEAINQGFERQAALRLARERIGRIKETDPIKRRKRIHDFLVRRGFDFDVCRDVILKI